MRFLKAFLTSRRRLKRLEFENRRLTIENKKLRAQIAKKPTIADRTNKKEQISIEQVITEYLYGAEGHV